MSLARPMPRPTRANTLLPWFRTLTDFESEIGQGGDVTALFDEPRPLEIDVGCGRGLFLVNASDTHPDINYLGIDTDYREGRRAAKRLQKRDSRNARILGGDVFTVFGSMVRPASLQAVHVYFPDPWWKARHRRRRVFTDRFVDRCAELLLPGGLLHSWTDVEEYFEVIEALMNHHPAFETLPAPEEQPAEHDLDYRTSFERKSRQKGLSICRGRWMRRTD